MHAVLRLAAIALLVRAAASAEPAPKLAPGSTFTVQFPEMPPTYAQLLDNRPVKAQMTVYLPADYAPGRKHPLLIFLNGGSGGVASSPSVARALVAEKGYVCVSLPLFKEKLDPPTPTSGTARILIRDADGAYAWPLYKEMLAKLDELVPNIDPQRRVLGGFSNGAHMTAALVNQTDGEAARRFSAFFLVDGGGGLKRFDLLKGKPLLDVCGRWRPNPRPAMDAGAKLTIYYMKKPEHAFPATEYPVVREWLQGKLPIGILDKPAEKASIPKVGDKAPAFKLPGTDGKE